jgi:hypothetical protein
LSILNFPNGGRSLSGLRPGFKKKTFFLEAAFGELASGNFQHRTYTNITMAEKTFMGKVIGAASQGAVGAVVGATLSAFTEPVVNRVLVKRIPLMQVVSCHEIL